MQVHTTLSEVGGLPVITVEGAIDFASIGTLRDDLARVIRQRPGDVVIVDLDAVTVLDDAGLGVLLGAAATARDAGGAIEIVCARPTLRARLEHTRLDRAVTVRSTITTP